MPPRRPLADDFRPLAVCRAATAVVPCLRAADAKALERAGGDGLSDGELATGVAAARRPMAAFGQDHRFARLSAAIAANPGARIAKRFRKP